MKYKLNLTIPTIRNTLKLNISQAFSFNFILNNSDIPYDFNKIKNYWWRWYSEIFGFYYNNIKRTYCIWVTTFLKKNLDIKMPFYFSTFDKNIKPLNKYKNYIFLYNCTLNYILISKLKFLNIFKNFNFERTNFKLLSEAAKYILFPKNKKHRSIGTFGILDWELNMFISTYNSKWNNLYNKNSIFHELSKMSQNFIMPINNYFFNSSFFINSFDSHLNLYTQNFLNYYNTYKFNNKFNALFKKQLFWKNLNIKYFSELINNYYYIININIINSYSTFLNIKIYYNLLILKVIKYKNWLNIYNLNKLYIFKSSIFLGNFKCNDLITYKFVGNNNPKFNNKIYILYLISKYIKKFKNQKIINFNNKLLNKIYINCLNHMKFKNIIFNNIIKFINKKFKKFNYIKVNNLKKNINLINKIKWITKYKKYFSKLYLLNFNNKQIINYINLKKTTKILWYFMYDEMFNNKIKNFILKITYFLFNIKKNNYNIYINNYTYNIKYNIIINYLYIINSISKVKIKNIYNLNSFDKNFIKILNFYCNNLKNSKKFNIKLKIKNLTYLKFL